MASARIVRERIPYRFIRDLQMKLRGTPFAILTRSGRRIPPSVPKRLGKWGSSLQRLLDQAITGRVVLLKPASTGQKSNENGISFHRPVGAPEECSGAMNVELHTIPSFLPTSPKISAARSRSARLCVAVMMVRRRAFPSGTVG